MVSIGVALSIDSFAVSAAGGCTRSRIPARSRLAAAAVFAAVQTAFTAAGWLAGAGALAAVETAVEYAAAALLFFVGAKMCLDALLSESGETVNFLSPLNAKLLLALAVATSIDALAVGVSLALVKTPAAALCAVVAAVTFCASLAGIAMGKAAVKISKRLPALGGAILIAMAALIVCGR